jgi:hypothetical protein
MPRNSSTLANQRSLTSSDPIELLEQAEVLRRRAEQSFGEYALEAGRLLIQAKKKLPHGSWAQHVQEHTGFSLRTAEVYMRARKRYDSLPASEKQSVLEQPFTRSLLVLAQAPKPTLSESGTGHQLPSPHTNGAGAGVAEVRDFLQQRDIETTQLMDQAVAYHPEPTPFDEFETPTPTVIDVPAQSASASDDVDILAPVSPEQAQAEVEAEFNEMNAEIARLEGVVRQQQRELGEMRSQAAQQKARQPGQPPRGWDYVADLYQYLKGDETQRSPESLARKAATLTGGREIIAFMEMFFAAARTQLNQVS